MLRFRETWGIVTAKFLSDAAWYFYLFWLPKYLYDARGFDIKAVGAFAWIPCAAAGIGCVAGGWLSSRLLVGNVPINHARKIALGLSAAVMPAVLLIPSVPSAWALAIFSLAYFGQQSWSTLVIILPTDMYPRNAIGAVAGLVGFGGAMGGVVFGQVVGTLLVFGMLLAPAAAGALLAHRIGMMMLIAAVIGAVSAWAGLLISYWFGLAAGASMVLVAVAAFFVVLAFVTWREGRRRTPEQERPSAPPAAETRA